MKDESIPEAFRQPVVKCRGDSFETVNDYESNNSMLDADHVWAKEHHLEFHPTITINDFTYRGDIDPTDIREAICAAYQERPQHCNLGEIWGQQAKPSDSWETFTSEGE